MSVEKVKRTITIEVTGVSKMVNRYVEHIFGIDGCYDVEACLKRMNVDVLVWNYKGVLKGARVLLHERATEVWREWAKKQGYKDYKEFLTAVENGVDEELRWFENIQIEE